MLGFFPAGDRKPGTMVMTAKWEVTRTGSEALKWSGRSYKGEVTVDWNTDVAAKQVVEGFHTCNHNGIITIGTDEGDIVLDH